MAGQACFSLFSSLRVFFLCQLICTSLQGGLLAVVFLTWCLRASNVRILGKKVEITSPCISLSQKHRVTPIPSHWLQISHKFSQTQVHIYLNKDRANFKNIWTEWSMVKWLWKREKKKKSTHYKPEHLLTLNSNLLLIQLLFNSIHRCCCTHIYKLPENTPMYILSRRKR